MELRFIGQGYNTAIGTSVAQSLIESLENKAFDTFRCIVAFASYSGVTGLTNSIIKSKSHIKYARVIVGIDQLGTSKEALEALLEWNVDAFVFNTNTSIIFHPKIYIFEGDVNVKIIIGSNNLTQTGLSQNIEGSIEVSFTKDNTDGMKFLKEIITYYDPIFTGIHPNLEPLSTNLVERLVSEGKVPSEAQRRAQNNKTQTAEPQNEIEDGQTMIFPSIPIQPLAKGFTPSKLSGTTPKIVALPDTVPIVHPKTSITPPDVGWNFTDINEVLVAEIGGGGRWTQISFAKENFINFFELPTTVGAKGRKKLRYIMDNGNIEADIEDISSAKVKKSINFNLEPKKVRESGVAYSTANKPIIIFIKINSQNFLYHFEAYGSQLYTELNRFLPGNNPNRLRRTVVTLENFRRNCPSFLLNA